MGLQALNRLIRHPWRGMRVPDPGQDPGEASAEPERPCRWPGGAWRPAPRRRPLGSGPGPSPAGCAPAWTVSAAS